MKEFRMYTLDVLYNLVQPFFPINEIKCSDLKRKKKKKKKITLEISSITAERKTL